MAAAGNSENADVLTVSALTARIRGCLEDEFQSLWVSGEVSNLARPNSGHIYLSLKDEKATIRAAIRGPIPLINPEPR